MIWKNEVRTCACGESFKPKRERQRHCSAICGTRARVAQHRTRYKESDPTVVFEKPLHALSEAPTASVHLPDGPTLPIIKGRIYRYRLRGPGSRESAGHFRLEP
jgi:hypothetical protein